MSQVQSELIVSEEIIDAIVRSEQQFCLEIRKCDPREAIDNLVNGYKGAYFHIEPFLGSYTEPKILEIGSGNGFGLCYLLKQGLEVVGIEPGELSFDGRFQRAINLLELNGIKPATARLLNAFAEKLPFEDNTFDIVFSVAVLEHVKDVERSMREALRVTKPDGLVIMNVPNYNSFREGHYNILWLPYLLARKSLAKWYVRNIFRRPDYYIDELNFTTPGHFRKMAEALPECREMQIYRLCDPPFAALSGRYYMRGLSLLMDGDKEHKHYTAREVSIYRGIRTLRGRLRYGLHLAGKRLSFSLMGLSLKLLSALGLSPVFNVVCTKRVASTDATTAK
ncbi:MAG TPA: class I SAM-dependent methyltransferase [Pyrinomonadaceae bacterium]|jgi:SAM-dependent methyltransferase